MIISKPDYDPYRECEADDCGMKPCDYGYICDHLGHESED